MTRMHTAHHANVSKSVSKNATSPRTQPLPCLITWQLQLLRYSFSVSQRPPIWKPPSHSSMCTVLWLGCCRGCRCRAPCGDQVSTSRATPDLPSAVLPHPPTIITGKTFDTAIRRLFSWHTAPDTLFLQSHAFDWF